MTLLKSNRNDNIIVIWRFGKWLNKKIICLRCIVSIAATTTATSCVPCINFYCTHFCRAAGMAHQMNHLQKILICQCRIDGSWSRCITKAWVGIYKVSGTVQNRNLLISLLFAVHYYFTGQPSQIHKAPTLLSPVCQAKHQCWVWYSSNIQQAMIISFLF